ncbi:hypothetical protein [Nakamurella sp. PAMC28650]|uniref:hypothetical protein n=1 Tax=Nakamurella sp. PAMC28650 TaxID=2762325 RepID=UPI00164D0D00|nr:hypothetical protein [Nakamurella sp. PAMC28650]QNK80381.1 hypothetical protein H7F38_19625 [Nakamurella sp. PAMC28650]
MTQLRRPGPSGTEQRIGTYPEFTLVEFPPALVHELDVLSSALDDPGPDLHAMLTLLTDDLTAAIPSFLGLIITSHLGDDVVTVRTVESRTAKSSLLLRFSPLPGIADCEVVLYAGKPGAFRGLVTGGCAMSGPADELVMDAHLPPPAHRLAPGTAIGIGIGIDELSPLHQAIGVLIDRGDAANPSAARSLLQDRADHHGITLTMAARQELHRLPNDDALRPGEQG